MLNHPNDQLGAEVLAFLSVFMYDGNKVVQVIPCSLYSCCVYIFCYDCEKVLVVQSISETSLKLKFDCVKHKII